MPVKQSVSTGEVYTLKTNVPSAPKQAGWYQLHVAYQQGQDEEHEVESLITHVSDAPAAQFMQIDFPHVISAGAKSVEVPVALRNPGRTAWPAQQTRVAYQWLSWDGQPIPGATGEMALPDSVKVGGATTLRMAVTPPPGSGVFRCAFTLFRGEQQAVLYTNPTTMGCPSPRRMCARRFTSRLT